MKYNRLYGHNKLLDLRSVFNRRLIFFVLIIFNVEQTPSGPKHEHETRLRCDFVVCVLDCV